jgi:hypothetical protein
MMRRNELSKVAPLSILALALLVAPDRAEAGQYPGLCTSASSACIYTGPDAPVLRADVCYNRVSVKLKGTGSCPTGSWPYYVDFGEVVDPLLGLVVAYAPLPDACDMGLCLTAQAEGDTESDALCCNPDTEDCSPLESGCAEDIVFCEQTATNEDGSVSCHDGE